MDFNSKVDAAVSKNNSLLCVGLDPSLERLPAHIQKLSDPFFEFNKALVDATADLVCAFKLNSAFYEALGLEGIDQLKKTADYIKDTYSDIPLILDAKRADIGNTNNGYVEFTFNYLRMDAVTLHPYLGEKALEPFLSLKDKGLIILCRTSNEGAEAIQLAETNGIPLYQHIAGQVAKWNTLDNCSLVMGATFPSEMSQVRQLVGEDMLFLVPGIGAQGGDIKQVVAQGANKQGKGLIISASRSVIYASEGEDFAKSAREEAENLRDTINKYR